MTLDTRHTPITAVFCANGRGFVVDRLVLTSLTAATPIRKLYVRAPASDFEHAMPITSDLVRPPAEIEREYTDAFWNRANPTLNDPFLRDLPPGTPLRFETGSETELRTLLRVFAWTDPDADLSDGAMLSFQSAVPGGAPAGLAEHSDLAASDRLRRLCAIAAEVLRPTGHDYAHVDGPRHRRSSYGAEPHSIDEYVPKPSGHDRAWAAGRLAGWLRDHAPAEAAALLPGARLD